MDKILLAPPSVFIIFLLLSMGLSRVASLFSSKLNAVPGKLKAYACGEDVLINKVQPDYKQFFPFAFFFTIMHIVVLMVTTAGSNIPILALLYILVAFISIFILYKR